MRVLLVPELYRPDNATANGSLNDLVALAEQWLDFDPTLHVYWLLPPRDRANYDREYVLADRERVTLIEAEPLMSDHHRVMTFVESGHSEAEYRALEREIFDAGGYVDVVVDQLVTGRYELFKWLLDLSDHAVAGVRPVELVGYVHDFRLPFKRHGREYPNDTPTKVDLLSALVADGLWFKAGVDADRMYEYGREYLRESVLTEMLAEAVQTGSPIDFDRFEERYADEPRVLHVAGSAWEKKNVDEVVSVGRTLHERYGIRTVMTSMDHIPERFAELPFVEAHSRTSREEFEAALAEGDITVCASDHETMARTWFEQAASGQVLVARDRPWIHDCVPSDHPLLGDRSELTDLAVWAVEHWEEAVAANRGLVAHVSGVRSPESCGRRTYRDLRRRVDDRVVAFDAGDPEATDAVVSALRATEGPVDLDALDRRTAAFTPDGRPAVARESFTRADLVYTLRSAGYADLGDAGAPTFIRAPEWQPTAAAQPAEGPRSGRRSGQR